MTTSYREILHKLIDIALVLLACVIAYKLRFDDWQLSPEYQLPTLVLLLTVHISLNVVGHYSDSSQHTLTGPWHRIFFAILAGALITGQFLYFSKTGSSFSRLWFGYSLGTVFVLCSFSFLLFDRFLFLSSRTTKIVVLGSREIADSIQQHFGGNQKRLEVVAFFDSQHDTDQRELAKLLKQPLSYIEQRRTSSEQAVSEIWISAEIYTKISPQKISIALGNVASRVVWIAELPDSVMALGSVSRVGNFVTLNSQFNNQSRLHLLLKSISDRVLAAIGLVLLIPVFAATSLAIKFNSKGPIFFKQLRYGLNGTEFEVWKFRTMNTAESTSEFKQATRGDARITKVGAFLRKHSIDELPQLINVVSGSMSLVGPRPHPNLLNENFRQQVDRYMARHCMKPGITGLAQVNGFRGETATLEDMEGRIFLDLEYVNRWSFILDIQIILKTMSIVFRDKNAY